MGKKKQEEHHGGAWKVAYADFVTAMMALFMVLWIISQDDEVLEATSSYFKDPFNFNPKSEISVMNLGNSSFSPDAKEEKSGQNTIDVAQLEKMAEELMRLLQTEDMPEDESPIDIEMTPEGLKITLYDRSNKPLFEGDSETFTQWGEFVMQNLAWLVDRHEMGVKIDAFSRVGVTFDKENYTPWELTSNRANAARRTMEHYALDSKKVQQVTGHGTRSTLPDKEPHDESNSRVEISLSVDGTFPEQ